MLYNSNDQLVFSLLMLTISLVIYFFLSNQEAPMYLYVSLAAILFIHGLVIGEYFFTVILLSLVLILASFRLSKKKLYLFITIASFLFIILTMVQKENMLLAILIGGMIVFLIIAQNKYSLKNQHEGDAIKKIKAEYRQLKRMQISMDEMARNEERTRIAREIHDSVGHQLTALMMKLEMLHIQTKDPHYLELKEMVDNSLGETRKAVQTLSGSDTSGITAVIQLIRKLEAESQLLIQFTLNEGVLSIPLLNKNGVVLYRIIQEALTNVMRHADTKFVSISIGKSAINSLTFSITNTLSYHKEISPGFGLENMKARVIEIGGKIEMVQTDNEFTLRGMIPYQ